MKNVKMLGLAAMGVIVLAAFFGASSASASVACRTSSDPCGAGWDFGPGGVLTATLKSGTSASLAAAFSEVKCTKSTVEAENTNTGGSGSEVEGSLTSFTFNECTCGARTAHVTTTALGGLRANNAATVTNTSTRFTINCTGLASCVFGTVAAGTDLGTVTDGEPGGLDVSANVTWSSGTGDSSQFVCAGFGDFVAFTATYEITNPSAFYIASE